MQEGYHYLVYASNLDSEPYQYEGNLILSVLGLQEAVYCISDEATAHNAVNDSILNFDYWNIWKEVMSKYGNVE